MSLSVTVLLPVHKYSEKFFVSLNACLNQTYKDYLVYILIDGLNENLYSQILKKYNKEIFRNNKIKIYYPKLNLGLTKILNKGIGISKRDLIMRNDYDDIPYKNKMKIQVDKFNSNEDLNMVYTFFHFINNNNKNFSYKRPKYTNNSLKKKLHYKNPIAHSSVMFKRDYIIKLGGYNEYYKVSQDFELWGRIINENLKNVGVIKQNLVKIGYSENSLSHSKSFEQRQNSLTICMNNRFYPKRFENIDVLNLNRKESSFYYAAKYAYFYEKKIKFVINKNFLINLINFYINHPSLLVKRIFTFFVI